MLYTDILEIKSVLEIDPEDTQEDKNLLFFNEWASAWFDEELGRPLSFNSRTQFLQGSNTPKLNLRYRPVYSVPTIQVYLDEAAYAGSATNAFDPTLTALVYGTDFYLDIDQEDGVRSKRGILVRVNDVWPRLNTRYTNFLAPWYRDNPGSIKVVYSGGYTVDTLPATLRFACNSLVARMRKFFPLALEMTGESYQERSINWAAERRDYLMAPILPILRRYRNWNW